MKLPTAPPGIDKRINIEHKHSKIFTQETVVHWSAFLAAACLLLGGGHSHKLGWPDQCGTTQGQRVAKAWATMKAMTVDVIL